MEQVVTWHRKFVNVQYSTYLCREVVLSQSYGTPCDVYSYAIIMYEVLFDTLKAYGEATVFGLEQRVAKDESFRPTIPQEHHVHTAVIDVMQQAWQQDPSKRPSFDHICTVLEADDTA